MISVDGFLMLDDALAKLDDERKVIDGQLITEVAKEKKFLSLLAMEVIEICWEVICYKPERLRGTC